MLLGSLAPLTSLPALPATAPLGAVPPGAALLGAAPSGAAGLFNPVAVLALCVVAAFGTYLLLPAARREASIRKIGGGLLLAVLLVFVAIVLRQVQRAGFGDLYFWIFSILAIVAAVRVISHPRPVYSALYFVLTVFASGGLFVLLWAEFMAMALILIYAGAILVTYVFVIMLASQARTGATGQQAEGAEYDRTSREPLLASAAGFLLMGVLIFVIFEKAQGLGRPAAAAATAGMAPATMPVRLSDVPAVASPARAATQPVPAAATTTRDLGLYLFDQQVLTLELAGLILTIAMVGAVLVARRQVPAVAAMAGEPLAPEVEAEPPAEALGPPVDVDDNPHSIPVHGTRNPQAKRFPEA